jgi:hypothetical protein
MAEEEAKDKEAAAAAASNPAKESTP